MNSLPAARVALDGRFRVADMTRPLPVARRELRSDPLRRRHRASRRRLRLPARNAPAHQARRNPDGHHAEHYFVALDGCAFSAAAFTIAIRGRSMNPRAIRCTISACAHFPELRYAAAHQRLPARRPSTRRTRNRSAMRTAIFAPWMWLYTLIAFRKGKIRSAARTQQGNAPHASLARHPLRRKSDARREENLMAAAPATRRAPRVFPRAKPPTA